MTFKEKSAFAYLAVLAPLAIAALVWSISGLVDGYLHIGPILLIVVASAIGSRIRIQLPGTELYLSVSDVVTVYTLLIFGVDLAVVSAAISSSLRSLNADGSDGELGWAQRPLYMAIATVSTAVTGGVCMIAFGIPGSTATILDKPAFSLLIGTLTVLPFVLSYGLASVLIAIRGEKRLLDVWTLNSFDGLLTYFGNALIAGLFVVASNAISVFLFAAAIGFFLILQLVHWRYERASERSRETSERSEKERLEQAEKHVVELQHYIKELERSGIALAASREKFRQAAFHDPLTGLPNRVQFIELVKKNLARTEIEHDYKFAVLHIDINNFKNVNDSLGRSVGDRLLSEIGYRLRQIVNRNGHVGRFGSDEFAVLLGGVDGTKSLIEYADEIVNRISEPYGFEERTVFIRASVGIAVGGADYENAEDVLRDADIAMYHAKEKRIGLAIFAYELLERAQSDLEVENALRYALKRNEFRLHYQPIIELETLRMIGFEALVRWHHPKLGFLGPDQFIPISEASGLIVPLTLQILEIACTQLAEWQKYSDPERPFFMSANISGRHFEHPELVDHIRKVVEKTGVDPSQLKLEITETALMENADAVTETLQQIRALGVSLSVDDFGTGYSSLSYLQRFPIDTLKIDRSFVRSMEEGRHNGEIVRAVLALASAMDLTVVAEGIESIHQLHQLRVLNCKFGQGYLFSKPVAADQFELIIRDRDRWLNLVEGTNYMVVDQPPADSQAYVN